MFEKYKIRCIQYTQTANKALKAISSVCIWIQLAVFLLVLLFIMP